jgi:hypothetical protein
MLIAMVHRHPRLTLPLFAVSLALLVAGIYALLP